MTTWVKTGKNKHRYPWWATMKITNCKVKVTRCRRTLERFELLARCLEGSALPDG